MERFMISVIVSTYNQPQALELVLLALADQDQQDFEIIIADDGSTAETSKLIQQLKVKLPYQINHVWHEDQGFRSAMIKNKAIAKALGNYLIFLDGDCIPRPSFIRGHRKLAEKTWFVSGNRVLLSQDFTQKVLNEKILIHKWRNLDWLKQYHQKFYNQFLPFVQLPINPFSKCSASKWQGAKGCNLGVWHQDLLKINGFDESYVGWGYEDSDLVVRLIRSGIQRKSGKFVVPVLHLWHLENNRDRTSLNYAKFNDVQKAEYFHTSVGLDQYLT